MPPASSPGRTDSQALLFLHAGPGRPDQTVLEQVRNPGRTYDAQPVQGDERLVLFHHTPRDGSPQSARGQSASTHMKDFEFSTAGEQSIVPATTLQPVEKMGFADPPPPTALPAEALAKYRKIAKLQDRFLAAQTSLKSERDTAVSMLNRVIETRTEMSQLLGPSGHLKRGSSAAKKWKDAHARLLEDESAFQARMQHVSEMEQALGKLEYRLAKLHPELLEILHQWVDFPPDTGNLDFSPSSDKSRGASDDMHPLELEYYEKRGDVRQLRDQLMDHQAEFQTPDEQTVALPLPTHTATDDSASYDHSAAFRTRWRVDHDALLQALYNAEQDLTRLWHACEDANLKVGRLSIELSGPFENPHHPEQTEDNDGAMGIAAPPFLPQDGDGLFPRILRNLRWPQSGVIAPPLIGELTKLAEKKHDIENWVAKLPWQPPGLGAEYNAIVEFEHAVSVTQSDPDWTMIHRSGADEDSSRDYVMIPEERSKSAPNGQPLDTQPGILRRVLRKWRSFSDMRQLSRTEREAVHRASEDIRHGSGLPP